MIGQGDRFGPIEWSLQVDDIEKESLHESLEPYKNKVIVALPKLSWIDDTITLSESGHKTARMNAFINAQLSRKKLRLGATTCVTLYIGNKHEKYKHVLLFVDGWSVKSVDSNTSEKYLG